MQQEVVTPLLPVNGHGAITVHAGGGRGTGGTESVPGLGGELREVRDSGWFGEETELLGTARPPVLQRGTLRLRAGKQLAQDDPLPP